METCDNCGATLPTVAILEMHKREFCEKAQSEAKATAAQKKSKAKTKPKPKANGKKPAQVETVGRLEIPIADPYYMISSEVAEEIGRILTLVDEDGAIENVAVIGPRGSGKTSLAKQIAAMRKSPYHAASAYLQRSSDEWFGSETISLAEGMVYNQSRFVEALETPGATVCINDLLLMQNKCLGGHMSIYVRNNGNPNRVRVWELNDLDSVDNLEVPDGQGNWRKVIAVSKQPIGKLLSVKLRDGSILRITPDHLCPLKSEQVVPASSLKPGHILATAQPLPAGKERALLDIGWVVGLYIAEGTNPRKHTIRFHLHQKEVEYASKIERLAESLGCSTSSSPDKRSKGMTITVTGRALEGAVLQFVDGKGSYQKHLSKYAWRQEKKFLDQVLRGYLDGDGSDQGGKMHFSEGDTWALSFTGRNNELASDLRLLSSILDLRCTLHKNHPKDEPKWQGYIRVASGHQAERPLSEVVEVKVGQGYSYNIEVEPDHTYALPNGVLTHNSVQNGLNDLLDPSMRSVWVDAIARVLGRAIRVAPNVLIIATWNAGSGYTGNITLADNIMDRFPNRIMMDYPPEEAQVAILMRKTSADYNTALRICQFSTRLRSLEEPIEVSIRSLLQIAKKVELGAHIKDAMMFTIIASEEPRVQTKMLATLETIYTPEEKQEERTRKVVWEAWEDGGEDMVKDSEVAKSKAGKQGRDEDWDQAEEGGQFASNPQRGRN